MKSGNLNFLKPSGYVTGLFYLLAFALPKDISKPETKSDYQLSSYLLIFLFSYDILKKKL